MAASLSPLGRCGPPALLDLTACLGLARYIQALDDPDPAFRLIRQDGEALARDAGLGGRDWPAQRAALAAAWSRAEGPLPSLALRLALRQEDLFLFGLAIACERRRAVSLAVMALQAPLASARPTLHLGLELVEALFGGGPGDALSLAAGPLVASGLIDLAGDDALPHRLLTAHLPLWRALTEDRPEWPGCKAIAGEAVAGLAEPAAARAVRAIASGEAEGLVIRGPPGAGRAALAAALARRIGLAPIEAPAKVFREDRAFATASRALGWLPVLRLAPEMGQAIDLEKREPAPFAVLVGGHGAVLGEKLIEVTLAPPPAPERARLWRQALGENAENIDRAIFDAAQLYPGTIEAVARFARLRAETEGRKADAADLAEARFALAPRGLSLLAHPVARRVSEAALVRPPILARDLDALIARCRRRETIWNDLGPALGADATRGVRALFSGESGVGKTLAAAYVATVLAAPLFRCDLAAVMNKYIGESEKNLGALFDLAEAADVILLFDEADALFGRRSDGGETGERYANMLTNYLLTRLESHNGVVILTTNARGRIDPAFWRRLDQAIDFPAPGYDERLALWRAHLGARAPDQPVLERLAAYCDLPGGGVRNAVLAAAALAPPEGPIGLDLLSPALRREYAKLKRAPPANLAIALRAVE